MTTTENKTAVFHLPTKPYTAIDCLNRISAAQGTMSHAMQSESANYNGHYCTLSWNDFRGYYVGEYTWAGRNVFTRSSDARTAIREAIGEYRRQGGGCSLHIRLLAEHADAANDFPELISGDEPKELPWLTWKHKEMASAYRLERQLGRPHTHWLLKAETIEEYRALCANPKSIA